MRARLPDTAGHLDRDGVRIGYEVYEATEGGPDVPTLVLVPTWLLATARIWKAQIPYLSRYFRVVAYDGPGNGRSDRPLDPAAYRHDQQVATLLAVLDETRTHQAVLVSLSRGCSWALDVAAHHPERVRGCVFIGPALPLAPPSEGTTRRRRLMGPFSDPAPDLPPSRAPFEQDPDEHWAKHRAAYWRRDWEDFARFFIGRAHVEPHSTKQIEDAVGWACETSAEVVLAEVAGADDPPPETLHAWCRQVRVPVLVLQGSEDRIISPDHATVLAAGTGGRLVSFEGSGHGIMGREPVRVNLLIREFVESVHASAGTGTATTAPPFTRARARRKRALYISSPIGLGHAARDLAIAQELRRHHPDLEIEWLSQDPVTRVLAAAGETVHPASRHLASESAHLTAESQGHDLHAFTAMRRMDEIMVANFHVFHDVVTATDYDLVIGDEAWDIDFFLHENPELKRFAYAWLTDFVGYLPFPDGGEHEARLTADYNAEMIEQIDRFPRVRDRSLFVGSPEDIVPGTFGPGLPVIRDWTREHFDFPGYVTGFDPTHLSDRAALRAELGYATDEPVCLVTVGGSGVGGALLEQVMAAYPMAQRHVTDLRMVVVTGPRIDPDILPTHEGLDVRAFVPQLYRHLAACDLALVQGGLTTGMELTATGRPFLYFPLGHHFEQSFHVHHRLQRYRAGRRMDIASTDPDGIAEAIATEFTRPVDYRPVESDGAARAAALVAELV